MKLRSLILSLSFIILSKTYAKPHSVKYPFNTILSEFYGKQYNFSYNAIFHHKEHDEELHIEEDLAILHTEPLLFIVILKQALSQPNPNISEIKELIKNNLSFINFVDPAENTALSLAVEANNEDIVEFLLHEGAYVIEKNKSLIIKALVSINWSKEKSYNASIKIIKLLLEYGANPNFKEICSISHTLFIWTPLRIALNIIPKDMGKHSIPIINLLIQHKVNINERFQPTDTTILNDAIALSKYATKKNYPSELIKTVKKVISLLLRSGAIK